MTNCSRPDSIASYSDMRFSRQTSSNSQQSLTDSCSPESGYIDFDFSAQHDTNHPEYVMTKLSNLQIRADIISNKQGTKSIEDENSSSADKKIWLKKIQEKRFPRVSQGSLKNDVEDFHTDLTVKLNALQLLADSYFLSGDFLFEAAALLQSLDSDARTLLEKLADLRGPGSVEFAQALFEYNSISEKILEVCNVLKFSMTLLKGYQSSQAEASVVAVEALVSLPKQAPRAVHVSRAQEAGRCIDSAQAEMVQMQAQVQELYGDLFYFVPNLSTVKAQADFEKWSGLWGILFAMKTASSYICQLLLAGLSHAGAGPAMILPSRNGASFNCRWASALEALHVHVRKQFNRLKDNRTSPCSFMTRDNDRLEFMLRDTKGHLRSLIDQGKILNIGAYLGSWQTDKKKLMHNVPRLRQHLLLTRHRCFQLSGLLESFAGDVIAGQAYLANM